MTFSEITFRVCFPKREILDIQASTERTGKLSYLLSSSETASNLGFHQASLFKGPNSVITCGHWHGVLIV